MDRQKVIEILDLTFPKMRALRYTGSSLSGRLQFSEVKEKIKISGKLAEVLKDQEEFSGPKNLHFNHGLGSMAFQPEDAALFLCRQAELVVAQKAVDHLEDILARKDGELICVMALRGVSCDKEIQLTESIRMVPLAHLPPSKRKENLQNSKPPSMGDLQSVSAFNPFFVEPADLERAFLITNIKIDPVLFDYEEMSDAKRSSINSSVIEAFSRLDEVRFCLTAIGNCSPLEEYRWKQFEDEILEDAANISSGMSYGSIEIKPFRLRKSEPIEEEKAAQILKSYFACPESYRKRIKIALNRLNQSMRRSTVGDAAVELSIALEVLLLGDGRGDNNFKVSLRSGITFSHELNERKECRETIKKIY
ncbi:MAG: hypothetical protein ACE5ER_09095, partial [Nitrospinaceae bacterium]